MKDERLVSKMEGKTNFSRRLKQFDGLTWLTHPLILRQIYVTVGVIGDTLHCAYLNSSSRLYMHHDK